MGNKVTTSIVSFSLDLQFRFGTAQTITLMRVSILQLVPLPSFVRTAVFLVVIQLSETLVELRLDRALLEVRHGQFVLLLNKSLRYKGRMMMNEMWGSFG